MKNTHLGVISILRENFGNYVSGEKIAKFLNISRVAVYKIIKKLLSEGYKIKSTKNLGYKLLNIPFLPQELLKENFKIVKQVYFYKTISSTMDIAKEIVNKNKDIENVLVIAEKQTKGKGRIKRRWFSPKGGVWFSLILKPNITPDKVFLLNYVFSLSVVNILKKYSIDAKTKWPNDVVVDDKKICGILIEADTELDRLNWCIVGVGINVNIKSQFFLKHNLQATSMYELLGKKVDLNEFLKNLFHELEIQYNKFVEGKIQEIISLWSLFCSTLGRKVKVITINEEIEGKVLKIHPETGALIVKTQSGEIKKILSGDCLHLRG
ncbi:MAG: biotin--[acetyl-CoA-carboxylase] ligase [Endomicrobia bacterium]|nr:biotin--[acetyl-CoA-carboxylase] ligase [Endomicrobiia bacterium]